MTHRGQLPERNSTDYNTISYADIVKRNLENKKQTNISSNYYSNINYRYKNISHEYKYRDNLAEYYKNGNHVNNKPNSSNKNIKPDTKTSGRHYYRENLYNKNRNNYTRHKYNTYNRHKSTNIKNELYRTTQRGRSEAVGEEQKLYEYRKTIEEKNVWKTPQRKVNNKPRRVIGKRIEAVEEQMINNNPINNSPKDHKKMTESCKTPKRKYKMNPRRINRDLEEIKEAGEAKEKSCLKQEK